MKRLLFIFILLVSCQPKVEEKGFLNSATGDQSDIWMDTVYYNSEYSGGMRYYGAWKDTAQHNDGIYPGWKDLDYGKCSDEDSKDSEMFYRAWMGGFDFYTYVDGHHGGYWINVDGNRTYVNLTEESRAIKKTFSVDNLTYGNHTVTITPIIDSTFIFVKLVKFVAYSPSDPGLPDTIPPITPPDIVIGDTVIIYDTIYKLVIDSVYLQPKIFIKADSIIYELE